MKKIVIDDCLECPIFKDCKEIKNLNREARLYMMIVAGSKRILKTCPLPDDK